MKKVIKKSLIFLLMLVMLPLSGLLSACGATPAEDALGVYFVSDLYDEETGKAIFEVDLKVETTLTYKCTPSTSSSAVNFTIPVEGQTNSSLNRSKFTFDEGKITVNYADFEQIEVKITVNGQTDQCIVRLKEYPVEIYPTETEVVLNSRASYTICAMGKFAKADGTFEYKPLLEKDYNFTVTSDQETVMSVPNPNRLTVCSVQSKSATANVTVVLNDQSGVSKGMTFKVKFIIIETAKDGYLRFDNFSKFVGNDDTLVVDANKLSANANGEYELHFRAFFISEVDTYIENIGSFNCKTDSSDYVTFDNEAQIIKVKSSIDLKLKITVWTELSKADNSILGITFNIDYKAKTS